MVPFYYTRINEKIEIALLDMFNNLRVNKYNGPSRTTYDRTVRVPIVIHQSSQFANWWTNANTPKNPSPIPVVGVRFVSKEPNSAGRTQPTYARAIFSRSNEQWIRDIQPTPYYFYYEMDILTDNLSDNRQLNENILPYFNTFRTLRIIEFDFAPDIERKVPVYLQSVNDKFEDEIQQAGKKQLYTTSIRFRLEADMYRPFEIPKLILYAGLNLSVDQFVNQMQWLVYPDPIAINEKKEWETISPSTRLGYSLLKSSAGSLVRISQATIDSNLVHEDDVYRTPNGDIYKILTTEDARRPIEVPTFELLNLSFDEDSPFETDLSGLNRNFVALNDSTREYYPAAQPNGGNSVEDGYAVQNNVIWDKILNWFGTNDGLNEQPFTFKISAQFKEEILSDTIFQYLKNDMTINHNDEIIPEGEVWFDWGIIDKKLYFNIKTYGSKALFNTFITDIEVNFNNVDIYTITFVLYDEGNQGIFGYQINGGPCITLDTNKV